MTRRADRVYPTHELPRFMWGLLARSRREVRPVLLEELTSQIMIFFLLLGVMVAWLCCGRPGGLLPPTPSSPRRASSPKWTSNGLFQLTPASTRASPSWSGRRRPPEFAIADQAGVNDDLSFLHWISKPPVAFDDGDKTPGPAEDGDRAMAEAGQIVGGSERTGIMIGRDRVGFDVVEDAVDEDKRSLRTLDGEDGLPCVGNEDNAVNPLPEHEPDALELMPAFSSVLQSRRL